MADIQIENQTTSAKAAEKLLPSASPSFDDDELFIDLDSKEVDKAHSARSEKTLSIEEEEAQESQSKNMLPSDKNELSPNTSSTKESSKSVADAPEIIDLTAFDEEKKGTSATSHGSKNEEVESSNADDLREKTNEESRKQKRKSKRASSSKHTSSKPRRSKSDAKKQEEAAGNKETSPKKKPSKKKITQKVASPNPVESSAARESSPPVQKTESTPVNKASEPTKTEKALPIVPSTPTKQVKNVTKKASPKAKVDPDDFLKRKRAKEARADELRNYLSAQGDTLMVEPRSDDSVSYLTIPQVLQGDANHHVDLNKLPKSQHPPRTVNPMISMGDDGELEPEKRISYDLEALMKHQGPPKPKESKWENVSVITDDVETVLGENDKAEIVSVQSNGLKVGHDSRSTNEFEDVDLEQPSKEATTTVGDCKSETRFNVATILEDLQNLMIRRPIAASAIFVLLVATLVFLGIALMQ